MKGDLDDVDGISALINGVDAVVCLANVPRGSKLGGDKDGWMPGVMKNILSAMKEHKVRRLLFQVGGFTLMADEVPPNCCITCCIKDCILGWCLGEELILKALVHIALSLATQEWPCNILHLSAGEPGYCRNARG